MPEYLQRRTAQIVDRYFNQDALPAAEDDPKIGEIATEAQIAFKKLLEWCKAVEANTKKGVTPMVTIAAVRRIIGENLETDQ